MVPVETEKSITQDVFENAAQILRVMAHPQRLRIVDRLLRDPVSVGELAGELGLAPAAVSQHLNQMRARSIVDCKRVGRIVRYEVVNANAKQLIACLRKYGDGCPGK